MSFTSKSLPLLLVLSLLPGNVSAAVPQAETMSAASHQPRRIISMEQLPKRSEVPAENRWKLEDMFASEEQWDAEYKEVKELITSASDFQGKLDSPQALKKCFELDDKLSLLTERLYVYAHMRQDEDTAAPKYQALSSKAKLGVEAGKPFLLSHRKFWPCQTEPWTSSLPILLSLTIPSP